MKKYLRLIILELIAVAISILLLNKQLKNEQNIILIVFSIIVFFGMRINVIIIKNDPKLIHMISYSLLTFFCSLMFIISLVGCIKEKEFSVLILVLFSMSLPLCAYFNDIRKLDISK